MNILKSSEKANTEAKTDWNLYLREPENTEFKNKLNKIKTTEEKSTEMTWFIKQVNTHNFQYCETIRTFIKLTTGEANRK